MGLYHEIYIRIRGKSDEINEFLRKHPIIEGSFFESFHPESDLNYLSIWEVTDFKTYVNIDTSCKWRIRPGVKEALNSMLEQYENKLKIMVIIEPENPDSNDDLSYIFGQTKCGCGFKKSAPDHTLPLRILKFIDAKYDIVPEACNVVLLEDEGLNEWEEYISYKVLFPKRCCPTIVLSNQTLNYSGNNTLDKAKTIDFATLTNYVFCLEVFLFKITSICESEELIRRLKQEFDLVKIIKPPMLNKRSSTRYVVCKKY